MKPDFFPAHSSSIRAFIPLCVPSHNLYVLFYLSLYLGFSLSSLLVLMKCCYERQCEETGDHSGLAQQALVLPLSRLLLIQRSA